MIMKTKDVVALVNSEYGTETAERFHREVKSDEIEFSAAMKIIDSFETGRVLPSMGRIGILPKEGQFSFDIV